jgi:hypothetical protein
MQRNHQIFQSKFRESRIWVIDQPNVVFINILAEIKRTVVGQVLKVRNLMNSARQSHTTMLLDIKEIIVNHCFRIRHRAVPIIGKVTNTRNEIFNLNQLYIRLFFLYCMLPFFYS